MTKDRDNLLPDELARALRSVARRARTVALLRGAAATLAVALACLLAVMAVDWWVVIFSDAVRWTLSVGALAVAVLAGLWLLVGPMLRRRSLADVAWAVDGRHPLFEERLSSAVELLTSEDEPSLRGSDELVAQLSRQATRDARDIHAEREISFRPARGPVAAALAALVVLAGLLAAWPGTTWLLMRRAMLANVGRVSGTSLKITSLTGGQVRPWGRDGTDYVMLAGGRLQIDLAVADDSVSAARLRRSGATGGDERVMKMARLGDAPDGTRRFSATLAPADGDVRFRIAAGDAITRYYTVRAVDPPAVRRIELSSTWPDYTRRRAERDDNASGDIAAVAGTEVRIRVHSSGQGATAEFMLDGRSWPLTRMSTGSAGAPAFSRTMTLAPGGPKAWALRLTDKYGFTNRPMAHGITVLPDRPPVAELRSPRPGDEPDKPVRKVRPTEHLPVAYSITDDFGLANASLEIEADGRKLTTVPLDSNATTGPAEGSFAATSPGYVEGATLLDLARLDLQGVKRLTLRVAGTDRRPSAMGGPGRGVSKPCVIEIDARAPSLAEQVVSEAENELRELLDGTIKDLKDASGDSSQLRRIAPKTKELPKTAVARVDRLRAKLSSADAKLRRALDVDVVDSFAGFRKKLSAVADGHVARAGQLAGQIKLLDEPDARGKAADEADFEVGRSIALLGDLAKGLGPAGRKAVKTFGSRGLGQLVAMAALDDSPSYPTQPPPANVNIAPDDWARLPGTLRERILQTAGKQPRGEYRELIRAYFQELARRGTAGKEEGK